MFFYLMLFVQVSVGIQDFIWPKNLGGGSVGEVDVIGRLSGPKGVGAGGGCAPSRAKPGKLKHRLILMFP